MYLENNYGQQVHRLRTLFDRLERSRICGSIVVIVIPPHKEIAPIRSNLLKEIGKSANIKDKNNRETVKEAQRSALEKLKCYNKAPEHGLIMICGRIMEEGSKTEKKIMYEIVPFKPINFSLYSCDSTFCLPQIRDRLFTNEAPYGFIIVDGESALFATLRGMETRILGEFNVNLPTTHNKGGYSANRYARTAKEKKHNYLRKVCEEAVKYFITDNKCNNKGLILAGKGDIKNELSTSSLFDQRLQAKIVSIVTVSQSSDQGMNEAIIKSAEIIGNTELVREKGVIESFYDQIRNDSDLIVYGIERTMKYLEERVLNKIICFQGLDYLRIKARNVQTGAHDIFYVRKEQEDDYDEFERGGETWVRIVENGEITNLVDWIKEQCSSFKCDLELVSDNSALATDFVNTFKGLGGFLTYKVEFEMETQEDEASEESEDQF